MKKLSKLLSLLLAMALCLSLAPAAFAAGTGSIQIDNAIEGATYKAYRLLDLAEGYTPPTNPEDPTDKGTGYLYTVNSAWTEFFAGAGAEYVDIHKDEGALEFVTWKEGANAQKFAQAALAYAKENDLGPVASEKATSTTVSFTGLDLGYYLVDSTAGALVSLNTADTTAEIEEKNEAPTIDKEVQEDGNNSWGETNNADTNQLVTFQSHLTLYKSSAPYTVDDTMTNLLFGEGKGAVTGIQLGQDTLSPVEMYCTVTPKAEGKGFTLTFTDDFMALLSDLDTDGKPIANNVVLTYTATLTSDAYEDVGSNDIFMKWGEGMETTHDQTKTYTGGLSILKTDGDTEGTPLSGAEFKLQNKAKQYAIVDVNGYVTGWTADETEGSTFTTGADGKIEVKGLDADTYTITETKAPTGYNALADTITATVEIADDGTVTVTYKDTNAAGDAQSAPAGVIPVENFTGTRLPSTGGIGTTIFYVIGGALVLGAAVLLITKKRMNGRD